MEGNYQRLIELISEDSGESIEEIERKIEAKQAKLSGLISKEGAAQVIAAELGVNFDKQVIKINQIVPNMKKINLVGKIINLFPIREYNKNGRSGKIGSFIIADDTSNIRTVLWDENHIDLIAKGEIKQDFNVEINNANIRNGELHLTSFSEIKPSEKVIENIVIERPVLKKKIVNFNINDDVSVRAFIVQMFSPRFFEVCPECRKKATEGKCVEHGPVNAEKRALINFVADDGSDSIRVVMFSDQIEKLLSNEELENPELFSLKRTELLGKEINITGNVRKNSMFGNNEFIISDIKDINIDELINELEK
jgi:ssDNA-binding replication factor A large subunit